MRDFFRKSMAPLSQIRKTKGLAGKESRLEVNVSEELSLRAREENLPLPGSLPGTDHSRVAFAQASATIPSPCPPVSSSAPVLGPDHDDGIPRAPASPRIRSGVRAGRGSTRGATASASHATARSEARG